MATNTTRRAPPLRPSTLARRHQIWALLSANPRRTNRELQQLTGASATSVISSDLCALERLGYISRTRATARALVVCIPVGSGL